MPRWAERLQNRTWACLLAIMQEWPALLLGLLAMAAFAPLYCFPAMPIAMLLLLVRWQSSSRPVACGFAFGLGYFGVGVHWLFIALHEFALAPVALGVIATLALVCYLSLFPALAGWLQQRFGRLSAPWRLLLVMPACLTLCELLRGYLFTGFPWLNIGVSQAPFSPLVGYAPILGEAGVTLLLLVACGALALAWHMRRPWPLALALGIWSGGWALHDCAWTKPLGAPLTVALVQGDIEQVAKWNRERIWYTLDIHTELTEQSSARLIVLPETAFPMFLDDVPDDYLRRLQRHARLNHGDVLLGVPRHTADHHQYLNSVISLGVSPPQSYSKDHLVPFGEYIPLKWALGWVYGLMSMPMVDFRAGGPLQPPLAVAGQHLALNICFEDVFGNELRHTVPRATMMANVTNDAWFGTSIGADQHLQITQMRAIETGRWWLRAANTGLTAIIDEHGRLVSTVPPWLPAKLEGRAQGRTGVPPYVYLGDDPVWLLVVLMLITAYWRSRFRD